MAKRRKDAMDLSNMLHYLRQGASVRETAKALGINRRTVKKYRQWAQEQNLLDGELPPLEELAERMKETLSTSLPPQNQSTVAPYHEAVVQLRQEGVEMAAIHQRLQERGFAGSYGAIWRYVQKLEGNLPEITVRVETPPGIEAQVDFGYAGMMLDTTGKARRAWAFVMTLSYSRHQYVEFVWDQQVATWLSCHRNAFASFGGVPERLVIDNLKAAILRACWDDPLVQRSYQECAEHYGFRIAPHRPRTPKHKGKVESGVHYVKRNFLGGKKELRLADANQQVLIWIEETAGQRIHGTTKEQPLQRFSEMEQTRLQPLPDTAYDLAEWKQAKLYRDCHIIFDNAYYSAPFRYVNQQLRVRGGCRQVRIYTDDYQLIATHDRAQKAGERQTHPAHLPPEMLDGLYLDRETALQVAIDIGPYCAQMVTDLLAERPRDRLATVRRLLRLREQHGDCRLESACGRALRFGDPSYPTVKKILTTGQEEKVDPTPILAPAQTFVRNAGELVGHLFGGGTWN